MEGASQPAEFPEHPGSSHLDLLQWGGPGRLDELVSILTAWND